MEWELAGNILELRYSLQDHVRAQELINASLTSTAILNPPGKHWTTTKKNISSCQQFAKGHIDEPKDLEKKKENEQEDD